jgi:hypothetical protein
VIAICRSSCDGAVDLAGWVVMLYSPEEQTLYGRTLQWRTQSRPICHLAATSVVVNIASTLAIACSSYSTLHRRNTR